MAGTIARCSTDPDSFNSVRLPDPLYPNFVQLPPPAGFVHKNTMKSLAMWDRLGCCNLLYASWPNEEDEGRTMYINRSFLQHFVDLSPINTCYAIPTSLDVACVTVTASRNLAAPSGIFEGNTVESLAEGMPDHIPENQRAFTAALSIFPGIVATYRILRIWDPSVTMEIVLADVEGVARVSFKILAKDHRFCRPADDVDLDLMRRSEWGAKGMLVRVDDNLGHYDNLDGFVARARMARTLIKQQAAVFLPSKLAPGLRLRQIKFHSDLDRNAEDLIRHLLAYSLA
jgi:hypothetical protein